MSSSGSQTYQIVPKVARRMWRFEDQGAAGDGVTDDSAAITATLDKTRPGDGILITSGRTFAHSAAIAITTPGLLITGGGALKALNPDNSALRIQASNTSVVGITKQVAGTARGTQLYQHSITIEGVDGCNIQDVLVDGSQAAGVFCYGATNHRITGCTVQNSLADAFHHTHGSRGGLVAGCVAINPGDDGHAVVSYATDPTACSDIRCYDFVLRGQAGGRGMSVVGGSGVVYDGFDLYDSWGAALYIDVEVGKYPISDVHARTGRIVRPNQGWSSGSQLGAIVFNNADATSTFDDVSAENIDIYDAGDSIGTTAGRCLWAAHNGAGAMTNGRMERIRLRGTRTLYAVTDSAAGAVIFQDIDLGRFTTAARPTPAHAHDGCTYWDTTLGLRAWCTGAAWNNGAGAAI